MGIVGVWILVLAMSTADKPILIVSMADKAACVQTLNSVQGYDEQFCWNPQTNEVVNR